jgi:predicted RNase H-like HicB family nuclease
VADTVEIRLNFNCTVKQETKQRWVAGCQLLDVYSQGKTRDEAKKNLKEALFAWVESCLERGTLDEALRQCGLQKIRPAKIRPGDQHISLSPLDTENPADTFPVHLSIPAYQPAALLSVQ